MAPTTTEYDLLEIFVSSFHRVLTHDDLMEKLNGRNWQPNDRVIDNHVAQFRKKIESPDESEWIKTVREVGYLFTSKISRSRHRSHYRKIQRFKGGFQGNKIS